MAMSSQRGVPAERRAASGLHMDTVFRPPPLAGCGILNRFLATRSHLRSEADLQAETALAAKTHVQSNSHRSLNTNG